MGVGTAADIVLLNLHGRVKARKNFGSTEVLSRTDARRSKIGARGGGKKDVRMYMMQ